MPQQDLGKALNNMLTYPQLYLSSEEAGWDGLVAQAFHEPMELEGWMAPAMSDVSLILFNGGSMRMEQRPINGSWRTQYIRQEDLILRPGVNIPHEVRWQGFPPRLRRPSTYI
ncbi:hypothetical protein [Dictyobacter kobayashii]|uniref:Uncharacterized protein n=1 Tax=Dictyobacter kobayashii TaxID=2014872 RepID=A0A402AQY1_9CHLR|nr:hypothetical protein [Dictyobacter kobayashii]GCE21506.1 hypothetical protein KDK_53060 [Dictyobacter kobayashii]